MQESSENRELVGPISSAYSDSIDLTSLQRTDQNETLENLLSDNNSVFTTYANIPDEIALLILHYLDIKDLGTASCINKKWLQLASDKKLSTELIGQYQQGNLWKYLSKKPDISTYQTYFGDVFGLQLDVSTFFSESSFTLFKHNFFLKSELFEKAKKIQEEFVQYLSILHSDSPLMQTIKDTKEIRSILDILEKKETFSLKQCNKVISLFMHIRNLEILFTDYFCVSHYSANKIRWSKSSWLDDPMKNQLLSNKAIVALTALLTDKIISHILNNPKLNHLVSRITEADILQIIDLHFTASEILINDPRIYPKVTDDILIYLTQVLPFSKLQEIFYNLIENEPTYYARWNDNLLITLGNKSNTFSYLILNNPRLHFLLNEDQFITLAINLTPYEVKKLLEGETFWRFKTTDKSKFLLRLPHLKEVIKNNIAAGMFLPETFFPLDQYDLRIVEALIQQSIILEKLTQDQLLQLALYHTDVALELLNNKKIIHRWSDDMLVKIEQKLGSYNYEAIKTSIQLVRNHYVKEQQKMGLLNKTKLHTLTLNSAKIKEPEVNNVMNFSSNPIKINSLKPSTKGNVSTNISWVSILLLTFTFFLGTGLLATGIGGLLGVGFMVTALTALSFLNVSLNSLAITFIIAGCSSCLPAILPVVIKIKDKLKSFFFHNLDSKKKVNKSVSSSYSDIFSKTLITDYKPSIRNSSNSENSKLEVYPALFVSSSSRRSIDTISENDSSIYLNNRQMDNCSISK